MTLRSAVILTVTAILAILLVSVLYDDTLTKMDKAVIACSAVIVLVVLSIGVSDA